MITLFIRHSVSNYQAWRTAYDDFATTQQALGVTAQAVYRGIADPNDITVACEFETLEAAQVFLLRDELKAAMQAAGVSGTPTIWFTTKV
jgi:hypothetical protein